MTTEMVKIARIRQDFGTQVRAYTRQDVIDDYAEKMAAGEKFPPVDLFEHGKNLILADGFNRVAARLKMGCKEIEAKIHKGTPLDALIFAAGANAKHGLQRTREDKIKAVTLLLQEPSIADKSNRAIADIANVSDPFVGEVRKRLEAVSGTTANASSCEPKKRTGKDGKKRAVAKKPAAREPGSDDNTYGKEAGQGTQGAATFDLKAFNASVGVVARHLDQLARDFGKVNKSGTIKETLEHKGIRSKLEEVQVDVVAWRKLLEKEKKDAAKQTP